MYYRDRTRSLYDSVREELDSKKPHVASTQLMQMTYEIERLAMLNEALWRVIRDRLDVSDEDLIRAVTDVDLEDGHLDGRRRLQHGPIECPRCNRTTTTKRPVCLYCGEPIVRNPFD